MHTIFYPGFQGQPCSAIQFIRLEKSEPFPLAHIFLYQDERQPGTTLINTEKGRNIVLNRVLSEELKGIRTDLIRFTLIFGENRGQRLHCFEYKVCLDYDDFIARGNRCVVEQAPAEDLKSAILNFVGKGQKSCSVYSHDVVGGCANFYTEQTRCALSEVEARSLLKDVGIEVANERFSEYS